MTVSKHLISMGIIRKQGNITSTADMEGVIALYQSGNKKLIHYAIPSAENRSVPN